jgi:hypothetical protein
MIALYTLMKLRAPRLDAQTLHVASRHCAIDSPTRARVVTGVTIRLSPWYE